MSDKITYKDVIEYEKLFTRVPSFVLERFARKNSNLVLKFKGQVESHLHKLNDKQRKKLDIILNTEVSELQRILDEAYDRTNVKQYKILADPEYRNFIESNLDEIKKII